MKIREVIMTGEQMDLLRRHLLRNPNREELAFLLVAPASASSRAKLLVRDVVPVPPDAFDRQDATGLVPKMDFVLPLIERCSQAGLGFIEAHSHPWDRGNTTFSGIDTGSIWQRYPALENILAGAPIGALVFGQQSVDGLLWVADEECLAPIHRLTVVDWPLQRAVTTFSLTHTDQRHPDRNGVFARQVLAFGAEGQEAIGHLRVGVVGLGGIGSILVEQLVRLGVREFVLVDQDIVEESNLNRLAGATVEDARAGVPKVEVATRALRAPGWPVRVEACQNSVQDEEALSRLKTADVLFGAVDSQGARLVMNKLAAQYLMPYIDCGTGILVESEGQIAAAGGQVRVIMPGKPCLLCQDAIDMDRAAYDLMPEEGRRRRHQAGYVQGYDVPQPAVMALNSVIASMAVDELLAMVTGYKPFSPWIAYDLLSRSSFGVSIDARDDCVVCGPGGKKALGDVEPMAEFRQRDTSGESVPPAGDSSGERRPIEEVRPDGIGQQAGAIEATAIGGSAAYGGRPHVSAKVRRLRFQLTKRYRQNERYSPKDLLVDLLWLADRVLQRGARRGHRRMAQRGAGSPRLAHKKTVNVLQTSEE